MDNNRLAQRALAIAIFIAIVCNVWLGWQLVNWFNERGLLYAFGW